jgi:hypothetical protein
MTHHFRERGNGNERVEAGYRWAKRKKKFCKKIN